MITDIVKWFLTRSSDDATNTEQEQATNSTSRGPQQVHPTEHPATESQAEGMNSLPNSWNPFNAPPSSGKMKPIEKPPLRPGIFARFMRQQSKQTLPQNRMGYPIGQMPRSVRSTPQRNPGRPAPYHAPRHPAFQNHPRPGYPGWRQNYGYPIQRTNVRPQGPRGSQPMQMNQFTMYPMNPRRSTSRPQTSRALPRRPFHCRDNGWY